MEARERLTRLQRRLPDLEGAPAGGILVAVLSHAAPCPECQAYLESLTAQATELAAWGARLHPGDAGLAAALGVDPPTIVIADEWREIQLLESSGQHALPSAQTVLEWVRWLGSRCPECEGEAF